MEQRAMKPVGVKNSNEYEAAVDRCLEQMRQLREQMDRDQSAIERLKSETRGILAEIRSA